jgi:signal transduction histidine kinase
VTETPEPDRYHPLTLEFRDGALEQRYRVDEAAIALPTLQAGARMSVVTWLMGVALALFTDWPQPREAIRLILFAVLPTIGLGLLLLRVRRDYVWQQVVGGFMNLIPGLVVYQVTIYAGQQEQAGLYLTLLASLFPFFLNRTRVVVAMCVVGSYSSVALVRHWAIRSPGERAFDIACVAVGFGVGAAAGWVLERTRRDEYRERVAVETAHAALRDAQAQLVQSEKMASLGKLVAGVAHDINTPLGAIAGTQQTLGKMVDKLRGALEKDHPDALESRRVDRTLSALSSASGTIGEGAKRLDEVVTRLRSFARLDEAELQDVSVAECVEDVCAMLEHQRPDGVELLANVPRLPPLRCHPADINQLLMNLVTNALEAVGEQGRISITGNVQDEQIVLVVEDDGPGIAADELEQVFDPGFTTKGVGVGGGFGLSIAYRIAERHGGSLTLQSDDGAGVRATLVVPVGGPGR